VVVVELDVLVRGQRPGHLLVPVAGFDQIALGVALGHQGFKIG